MSFWDKEQSVYETLSSETTYQAWKKEQAERWEKFDEKHAHEPSVWEQFMAMKDADPDYDAKCIAEALEEEALENAQAA